MNEIQDLIKQFIFDLRVALDGDIQSKLRSNLSDYAMKFTTADIKEAVETLEANNVKPDKSGDYLLPVHPSNSKRFMHALRWPPDTVTVQLASKERKKRKKVFCPISGCKNASVPIYGHVCAKHKDLPKHVIKQERKARKARKAGK